MADIKLGVRDQELFLSISKKGDDESGNPLNLILMNNASNNYTFFTASDGVREDNYSFFLLFDPNTILSQSLSKNNYKLFSDDGQGWEEMNASDSSMMILPTINSRIILYFLIKNKATFNKRFKVALNSAKVAKPISANAQFKWQIRETGGQRLYNQSPFTIAKQADPNTSKKADPNTSKKADPNLSKKIIQDQELLLSIINEGTPEYGNPLNFIFTNNATIDYNLFSNSSTIDANNYSFFLQFDFGTIYPKGIEEVTYSVFFNDNDFGNEKGWKKINNGRFSTLLAGGEGSTFSTRLYFLLKDSNILQGRLKVALNNVNLFSPMFEGVKLIGQVRTVDKSEYYNQGPFAIEKQIEPKKVKDKTLNPLSIAIINKSSTSHAANELYIEDSDKGNQLSLTLSNTGKAINLYNPPKGNLSKGNANKQNYSFFLYFQPNAIRLEDLDIKVSGAKDLSWSITSKVNSDKSINIYFLSKKASATTVSAKKPLNIILNNLRPDSGPSRVANVEWHLKDNTSKEFFCKTYLNIISHKGQEFIPLKASIEKGQYLLNNSTPNDILINLVNTSRNTTLNFTNATISLTFYVQDKAKSTFALTEKTNLPNSANVKINKQNVTSSSEGINAVYSAKGFGSIKAKGNISISISSLITALPPGFTNIEIEYFGVDGYWDGKIVVPLRRGPLVETNNNTFKGNLTLSKGNVNLQDGNLTLNKVNATTAPLRISPSDNGSKITFWEDSEKAEKCYGIGVSDGQMNYGIRKADKNYSHVFLAGGRNDKGTELLRIQGDKNIIVPGQLTLKGGSPGAGKVLTSDASGKASWGAMVENVAYSSIQIDAGDSNHTTFPTISSKEDKNFLCGLRGTKIKQGNLLLINAWAKVNFTTGDPPDYFNFNVELETNSGKKYPFHVNFIIDDIGETGKSRHYRFLKTVETFIVPDLDSEDLFGRAYLKISTVGSDDEWRIEDGDIKVIKIGC